MKRPSRVKRRKRGSQTRIIYGVLTALLLIVIVFFVKNVKTYAPLNISPKEIRGIYLPNYILSDEYELGERIKFMKRNRLNAVVIDFKDDYGQVATSSKVKEGHVGDGIDIDGILHTLKKNNIYPIARIVCFKDQEYSTYNPELSFIDKETGEIWQDPGGYQYINPMCQEVKDYILDVTKAAHEAGFNEVMYDYIRFPEGFHLRSDELVYNFGSYQDQGGSERVQAINDFLDQAQDRFKDNNLKIGSAIFGYATIAGDAPDLVGIGQNFKAMSERSDVVSAMIYPSHWSSGFAGLTNPDLHPYELIDSYMDIEDSVLAEVDEVPVTRPWLQAFTDYSLPEGTYQEYGKDEIEEQIKALEKHGVKEYYLWNILGDYPEM